MNTSWSVVKPTKGAYVQGTYGHTSAYDSYTNRIYIYGGFYATSQTAGTVTDRLLAYDPDNQIWYAMA